MSKKERQDTVPLPEILETLRWAARQAAKVEDCFAPMSAPREVADLRYELQEVVNRMDAGKPHPYAPMILDDPVISVAGLGGSRYSEIPLSDREGPDPEPFADVEADDDAEN